MQKALRIVLRVQMAALICLLLAEPLRAADAPPPDLLRIFNDPPEEAKPWVFWYWLKGAVSREGISADLEAMKQAGIGGAYLMPIQAPKENEPPLYEPATLQLSPRWWEMLRFAVAEADRLGVKIALHSSDGFATAGGPWITPELSMQRVTWSRTTHDAGAGGGNFSGALPQPPTKESHYRDIAVLAFPEPRGADVTTRTVVPRVTTDIPGLDAQGLAGDGVRFRSETPCWALYEFKEPFTCRSITIRPGGGNYHGNRLIVEVSDDGKNFRSLGRLEEPRHGWQDKDADATHAISATTAKYFRFVFNKDDMEPGAEDLDSAKWPNRLLVNQIELSSEARIPHYEGKSGVVWRRSSRATDDLIPETVCVPKSAIVNLTDKLRADGTLDWTAPPGRWIIMRIGHTSTGRKNETGGGGIGLECDKFNEAAVRTQFNGWLGESVRRIGPDLADRVVKIFHTDSWEAGSQNWSPVFLEEFRKRRGYDPVPWMPVFAGVPVESADASERFLYDVRLTITDLASEVYFATMVKLAHEHGCVFSCESVAPTMMGDGMQHYREVDIPMGEFWLRSPTHDKPTDMADAISAAHVYGKRIVQAEAFTELRLLWDEHPAMLKAPGDLQFALGINRFVFHVFMHNPEPAKKPGVTLNGVGLFFQPNQTWWEPGRAWIEYITRCQTLLQQGAPVKDVAYFTGEELPARSFPPDKMAAMPPALKLPAGYSSDSINRDALLRLAKVDAASCRLVLPGGVSYAALVLPDTQSRMMTPELAAKIGGFIQQGLPVLALGGLPEKSPGLGGYPSCDDSVKRIVAETWKGARTQGTLADVLKEAKVKPDLTIEETIVEPTDRAGEGIKRIVNNPADIAWIHRNVRGDDIYFISNQLARERTLEITLRGAGREVTVLDAVTGKKDHSPGWDFLMKNHTTVNLRMNLNESVFVVLAGRAASEAPMALVSHTHKTELGGPWQVKFSEAQRGPREPVLFSELCDWSKRTEPGIRYYSGTAVYTKTFTWLPRFGVPPRRAWLDLGEVANIATVRLNGKSCGTVWTAPWRADITDVIKPGENELYIEVTNTWANRLAGDQELPENERKTWTNAPFRRQSRELLPAGLLGPVSIVEERDECSCTGDMDDGADSPMVEHALRQIMKNGKSGKITYRLARPSENFEKSGGEAFIIRRDGDRAEVIAGGPAGILYGVQEALAEHPVVGAEGAPDFGIRGTVLLLISANWAYQSDLSPETYPWFFDKAFMRRYLDMMLSARLNTLVLWSGHLFPHIMELPEYPDASQFSKEEIRRNKEQFRWLAEECARRNITVLTHFYNIHISEHMAKALGRSGDVSETETDPTRYTVPDDFVRGYYRAILKKYFDEFPNVGLYICPGESLEPKEQTAWFRDVIFKAAAESGKNPKLIIRDWTLDPDFKAALPSLYPNLFSERKHNDETISSPWPDVRHREWAGVLGGHIVNLHDPADATPYRVGSPRLIGEMIRHWKDAGIFSGAWFYPPQGWCWPGTLDIVQAPGAEPSAAASGLDALDRDPLWFLLQGRYLWKANRDIAGERAWTAGYLARKFGDSRVGDLLVDWYDYTAPILPGLQNLTAVRYGNFFPTAAVWVQATVDDILSYRARVDDPPIAGTTGLVRQRYYSQPVDAYTIELYKKWNGVAGELKDLRSMPVAQYAAQLAAGKAVDGYMLPDKLFEVYIRMARESLAKAEEAARIGGNDAAELHRFVQDSRCLLMTVEYYQHKVHAALAKRMFEETGDEKYAQQLRERMTASVAKYAGLIAYAKRYYRGATAMFSARSWDDVFDVKVKGDFETQMKWLAERNAPQ